jgi:hypothetical protein
VRAESPGLKAQAQKHQLRVTGAERPVRSRRLQATQVQSSGYGPADRWMGAAGFEPATAPSAMISPMEQRHVKLSGDVEGSFVIEEALADGRFVVAPEWPSKATSADAILERAGAKRMSPEEFEKHFGDLPTDSEG